ncbi:MAG: M48 family metalloprotease [Nocardioidaceae bacterium]
MTIDYPVYLPLLGSGLLGAGASVLARRLPPVAAVRLLVFSGVVVAACSCYVLGTLAFTLLALFPPIAALGHWSSSVLAASAPVPRMVMIAAAAVLGLIALGTLHVIVRRSRELLAARALGLEFGTTPRQLHIVDEDIGVFAVPTAHGGHIIASRRLLAALHAPERKAVLAHEAAHLAHHHHGYRLVADLAATLNPLLRPLSAAVRFATERWADEVAATAVGDRAVVARALARASLHSQSIPPAALRQAATLDAAGTAVVERVEALLRPTPRPQPALMAAVAALLVMTVGCVADAQQDTAQTFDHAKAQHAAANSGSSAVPRRS